MATDHPRSFGGSLTPAGPGDFAAEPAEDRPGDGGGGWPGWRWILGASAFYLICLTAATWPAIPRMATELPARVDPLAHIWTMRWTKSCLLEGKLSFRCPDIQYPVGAALGTLPPMHFQTLLFVPLSLAFGNDILCYNLIRTFAFVLMGVGTMLLICAVVRDRAAATVGGLLAMLSQPMTFFSQGELEQITVGWFPIFLVAWTRWVDRPTGRGLAAAAVLYLLVAMSAPYFGVFAVFPASLYVAWRWWAAGRGGEGFGPWLKARMGWFAGFAALVAPAMVLLFANQIWAVRHGFSLTRPDGEFFICRVPAWTYVVPSPVHRLSRLLPFSTYVMDEVGSVPAYLGVATLALIAYAGLARVRFARRGYWWAAFGLLLVLSLGAHARVGGYDVSLPAAWLKRYFIGFRMIRVPARFCLFAAVGAALLAAAGLHHLLGRARSTAARRAILGAVAAVAVLDLGVVPYQTVTVPPVPPCYDFIRAQDPKAVIADVPHYNDGAFNLPSVAAYWQSIHGLTTTAGYTAFVNARQNNVMAYASPFNAFRLADPDYLADPGDEHFELVQHQDFRSYAWLYLTAHKIRFVVVHHAPEAFPELKVRTDRVEAALREALVYDDGQAAVFDREKLRPPTRPVILHEQGFGHRVARREEGTILVGPAARLWAYAPDADQRLTFTLDAAGHKAPRRVTLRADGRDVARWTVPATDIELIASPSFKLPAGLHELTLLADGAAPPSRTDAHIPGDKTPFSLWVTGIGFGPTDWQHLAGRQIADRIVR